MKSLKVCVIGCGYVGLVTGACLTVGAPLSRIVLELAATHTLARRPVALVLAGAVAGAAVWKVTHGTAGARWYFVGGLASAAARGCRCGDLLARTNDRP